MVLDHRIDSVSLAQEMENEVFHILDVLWCLVVEDAELVVVLERVALVANRV